MYEIMMYGRRCQSILRRRALGSMDANLSDGGSSFSSARDASRKDGDLLSTSCSCEAIATFARRQVQEETKQRADSARDNAIDSKRYGRKRRKHADDCDIDASRR